MKTFAVLISFTGLLCTGCFENPCEDLKKPGLQGYQDGDTIEVLEGKSVTLSMNCVNSTQDADCKWVLPNRQSIDSDTLRIGPMIKEMEGKYQIIATDGECSSSISFNLIFEESPFDADPICNPPIGILTHFSDDTRKNYEFKQGFRKKNNDGTYLCEIALNDRSWIYISFDQEPIPANYVSGEVDAQNPSSIVEAVFIYENSSTFESDKDGSKEDLIYVREEGGGLVVTFCKFPVYHYQSDKENLISGKLELL